MRHKHQRAGPALEEVLQPLDGVDVEVIGGLVEQQQVGGGHERPGEQHPPLHSRGERLKRRLGGEFHPREDLVDGVLPPPDEVVVELVDGDDGGRLPRAYGDHVADGAREIAGHVLPENGHRRAGSRDHRTRVGLDQARQHPHQRGLAGPVPAEQADSLARFDMTRHAVEERRPAKPHGHVPKGDQRHRAVS